MKFKIKTKGRITQWFANKHDNNPARVTHTGVDWVQGYGKPIYSDNAGYCYKLYQPGDRDDNWSAVYLLVPDGDDFMEVCIGHMSFITDGIADNWVLEGQYLGNEGNCGGVYSGGVAITPEMQRRGDKRGSHVHEGYRPVKSVKRVTKGKHYLQRGGKKYRGEDGCYFEIKHKNDTRGCVDPMLFEYKDTMYDKLRIAGKIINWIKVKYL